MIWYLFPGNSQEIPQKAASHEKQIEPDARRLRRVAKYCEI
jgi:hypothetical protein